jgi:hypothetical protein
MYSVMPGAHTPRYIKKSAFSFPNGKFFDQYFLIGKVKRGIPNFPEQESSPTALGLRANRDILMCDDNVSCFLKDEFFRNFLSCVSEKFGNYIHVRLQTVDLSFKTILLTQVSFKISFKRNYVLWLFFSLQICKFHVFAYF